MNKIYYTIDKKYLQHVSVKIRKTKFKTLLTYTLVGCKIKNVSIYIDIGFLR